MAKDFDTRSDARFEGGSGTKDDTGSDFGGDIATDGGVDLNDGNLMNKSRAEQFRGAVGNLAHGAAEWSAAHPPNESTTSAGRYFAGMTIGVRDELGQVVYHGTAATMEAAINQYGNPTVEHNMAVIDQAIEDGAESAERPEPVEPFTEGQPVYLGDTGIDLTDERLQGYDNIDDVPSEILNQVGDIPGE